MLRHTSIFKYLKLPDSQRNHCFPVAGQLCFSPCKHHCQGSAGRASLVALQCCKRYPSIYASRGEWQLKFKATYLNDSCSRMRWKTMGGNSTTSGSTVFTPSSYVVQTRRDNVYKHILSTCALQLQIQRGWRTSHFGFHILTIHFVRDDLTQNSVKIRRSVMISLLSFKNST